MMYNRKCPICGKLFYVGTSDWVYKKVIRINRNMHTQEYYCSWTCYNIALKKRKGGAVKDDT